MVNFIAFIITFAVAGYLGAKYGAKAAHTAVVELRKDMGFVHKLLHDEVTKVKDSVHSTESLLVAAFRKEVAAAGGEEDKIEAEVKALVEKAVDRLKKVL